MKKYIILISIIGFFSLQSQNTNPAPLKFDFKTADGVQKTNEELKYDYFPNDEFMIGWQWGADPKIAKELKTNYVQGDWFIFEGDDNYSGLSDRYKSSSANVFRISENAHSYIFEPTLLHNNPYNDDEFQERSGEKSIFGFYNINGTILNDSTDVNYKRLVLDKDSLDNYTDSIAFSGCWYPRLFEHSSEDWYLTINLRRLDTHNTLKNSNVVLTVQIEYFLTGDPTKRYIKFYKKPKLDSTYRIEHTNYRGHSYYTYEDVGNYDDELVITSEMIPTDSDTLSNDITVSSNFITKINPDPNIIYLNPSFNEGEDLEIDSINVIAKYHGELDVAIDWIRIENNDAYNLLRGKDDDNIQDFVQDYIDSTEAGDTYEFFRVYNTGGGDGLIPWAWESFNYHNKLLNGLTITSRPSAHSALQNFYVGSYEMWTTGNNFRGAGSRLATPYWQIQYKAPIRTSANYTKSSSLLGHSWYNVDNDGTNLTPDTLNSFYESSFLKIIYDEFGNWKYQHSPLKLTDTNFLEELRALPFDDYARHLNEFTNATLAKLELQSHSNYFIYTDRLYSEKPWWSQLFVVSNWGGRYDPTYSNPYIPVVDSKNHTPHTGEQVRFMINNSILWGAKGLMYDRMASYDNFKSPDSSEASKIVQFQDGGKLYAIGVTTGSADSVNNSLTGLEYLNQTGLGGDFVNQSHESNNINYYLEFDSLSQYMNTPTDRIFLGRKSQRREMYKLHTWINEVSDELMELEFKAGYIKSFREYYTQNPSFSEDTVLNKFISLDSNTLELVNLPKKSLFNPNPIEPYTDSTFFDITLLKHNNADLDSVFYIGVQNRRTDPMIRYIDPDNSSNKYLRFLTTAELEDYCLNGGEGQSASHWQDYYWKRLGTRRFELPFKYIFSDNNTYNLLKITELGNDSPLLDTAWYFNFPYNDRVTDTVIGENRSLSFNLLPGQGKILKVEVLKPDTVAGFLDNYNQTNLISHPTVLS